MLVIRLSRKTVGEKAAHPRVQKRTGRSGRARRPDTLFSREGVRGDREIALLLRAGNCQEFVRANSNGTGLAGSAAP